MSWQRALKAGRLQWRMNGWPTREWSRRASEFCGARLIRDLRRPNHTTVDRHALLRLANSCGLLLIPALAWNLAWAGQLPPAFSRAVFWNDIPTLLAIAENATRTVVFALPFFMPLEIATPVQRRGLAMFAAGTLVYFASWLPLISSPSSAWSASAAGFMAPAYTPFLWLLGLAMLGRRLFWGRFYRWWFYLAIAVLFLSAHILHTSIVYARTLPAGA